MKEGKARGRKESLRTETQKNLGRECVMLADSAQEPDEFRVKEGWLGP